MKLKVKFDFVHDLNKQMEEASEEELREYKENKDDFIKRGIEDFKENLKNELNYDDYCWIENLEVEYED
ncbi:hypothetical protein SAMN00017477_0890 [Peptoniphilus asaccharolyticus DSM 20463]|uniref:Uncharacterized protein n=1 Tax=Peptoniphilus asaccharolyticus DSM 20463 TaxID=573058 RepID=A0A1W1UZ96_PEPAS|nr:hypothetical protein [Peptoniphilus asaccharolyticus]MBL7575385.1 hypothetical protein [Peptoniphilus asaccharolyticus]SMB86389.1 hypothetical protein SAMN00017477_0890 [Peptoniphilus asaccharolyticus DSM 20463]